MKKEPHLIYKGEMRFLSLYYIIIIRHPIQGRRNTTIHMKGHLIVLRFCHQLGKSAHSDNTYAFGRKEFQNIGRKFPVPSKFKFTSATAHDNARIKQIAIAIQIRLRCDQNTLMRLSLTIG